MNICVSVADGFNQRGLNAVESSQGLLMDGGLVQWIIERRTLHDGM